MLTKRQQADRPWCRVQELKLDLQGAKAATEKAAASGHKHQAAVAQLTGDNLVLVLRAKAAEDEVMALKKEREELRAAIDEQRGPWFDEVLPWRQTYTTIPEVGGAPLCH